MPVIGSDPRAPDMGPSGLDTAEAQPTGPEPARGSVPGGPTDQHRGKPAAQEKGSRGGRPGRGPQGCAHSPARGSGPGR